jgi:2-hydroxy-3-keto-5-methylthiopentenyl-1-phosphate phosphatase
MGGLELIIVSDFDGTMADTEDIIWEIGKDKAKKYFGVDLTEDDKEHFREMGARDILKAIINRFLPTDKDYKKDNSHLQRIMHNLNFYWKSCWKIPKALNEGMKEFHEQRDIIQPRKGILEAYQKLSEKGYEIVTLSSNQPKTIHEIFSNWKYHCNGIYHCRTFFGFPTLFGKHLELKKIMRDYGLRKSRLKTLKDDISQNGMVSTLTDIIKNGIWRYDTTRIMCIDDEKRGFDEYQELGVRMIGIPGLNNEKGLLDGGLPPDHLVRHASEIPEKVEYIRAKFTKITSDSSSRYCSQPQSYPSS